MKHLPYLLFALWASIFAARGQSVIMTDVISVSTNVAATNTLESVPPPTIKPQPTTNSPVDSAIATGTFFNSVEQYFTSFNTNSTTFQLEHVECWAGVDQGGGSLNAVIGLTYHAIPTYHIFIEPVFENATVAGSLESAAGGAGAYYILYDTETSVGVDVGYRFDLNAPFVSPFVDVRKALTTHTFAGMRLYYQYVFTDKQAHSPGLFIITGFTF